MAPGPQSSTLDLLEKSLIHAKAEEQHEAHRRKLKELAQSSAGWANVGSTFDVDFEKIPKDLQQHLQSGQPIGSTGGFGLVRRIVYQNVPLAKKSILTFSRAELNRIKSEVAIGKKLDGHRHIVNLVGTYTTTTDGNIFLNILTFPVAACDLNKLLNDCEALNGRYRDLSLWQSCDMSVRFMALGYSDHDSLWETHEALNRRLKEIMGCLAKAVKWMHSQDVQHRDLKPENVLLRPGQVYLTDFGISRSSPNKTTESNAGQSKGYSAPEVSEMDAIDPALADVYSLGCIYLHIMTVLRGARTGARRKACHAILLSNPSKRELEIERYMVEVLWLPKHAGGPRPLLTINLLAPLLYNDRRQRPSIKRLDSDLWDAGGRNHVYHGQCCQNV